jgi:hypothetical protein
VALGGTTGGIACNPATDADDVRPIDSDCRRLVGAVALDAR